MIYKAVNAACKCAFLATEGSPYAGKLIAERQEYLRSVSESRRRELWGEEDILEGEAGDSDVTTKFGELVLIGLADLLDHPVQTQSFEKT